MSFNPHQSPTQAINAALSAPRMRQVDDHMGRLQSEIAEMSDVVSNLITRLHPVCNSESRRDVAATIPPDEQLCSVAEGLRQSYRRVACHNEQLRDLLASLEI